MEVDHTGQWQDGDGNWISPPTAAQLAEHTTPYPVTPGAPGDPLDSPVLTQTIVTDVGYRPPQSQPVNLVSPVTDSGASHTGSAIGDGSLLYPVMVRSRGDGGGGSTASQPTLPVFAILAICFFGALVLAGK